MEIKQLLYSLLPLLLIVVFSWLFRSRRANDDEFEDREDTLIFHDDTDEYDESHEDEDSFDPMSRPDSAYQNYEAQAERHDHHEDLIKGRDASRKMISPEPIKPKLWG